jgi:bifunctional non-homologous end joining protein LigD
VQCVVIGYLIDPDKTLAGLVLAALDGEELRYAGIVRRGFTPETSKELLKRLSPLVRPTPLIPELQLSAIWVKPQVFCEVHQSGYDDQAHLLNPKFAGLLKQQ